jgi:hypothetical protein
LTQILGHQTSGVNATCFPKDRNGDEAMDSALANPLPQVHGRRLPARARDLVIREHGCNKPQPTSDAVAQTTYESCIPKSWNELERMIGETYDTC